MNEHRTVYDQLGGILAELVNNYKPWVYKREELLNGLDEQGRMWLNELVSWFGGEVPTEDL